MIQNPLTVAIGSIMFLIMVFMVIGQIRSLTPKHKRK